MFNDRITRRTFLAGAAAAAGPWIVPSKVLGKDAGVAPSNRIALAVVGLGPRNTSNLGHFLAQSDVQCAAVCDCFADRRRRGKEMIDLRYGGGWGGNSPAAVEPEPDRNVFDYDRWLGQAPWAPYSSAQVALWRNRWDTSAGIIADMGAHYFDFFFGVADRKTHAGLWRVLQDEFGPEREKTNAHTEDHVANSFIGNMLRMELLSEAGRGQQILDESVAYLLYMAERTGTLWENVGAYASCNHGFASHIVHTLYRDILGLRRVDPVHKRIEIRFQDLKLTECEGTLPTPDGPVALRWNVKQDQLQYQLTHPPGYQMTIENLSGKRLKSL